MGRPQRYVFAGRGPPHPWLFRFHVILRLECEDAPCRATFLSHQILKSWQRSPLTGIACDRSNNAMRLRLPLRLAIFN